MEKRRKKGEGRKKRKVRRSKTGKNPQEKTK